MKISVTTTVGGTEFNFIIDENKDMEALHKAAVLGNPPNYCSECKNNQYFRLDSNKDKDGNIYVNMTCKKCGAKSKLGQYKAGGYFWHKFEKYVKEGTKQETKPEIDNNSETSDLPF